MLPSGATLRYSHDNFGRVIGGAIDDTVLFRTTYNSSGNVASHTDIARSIVTSYLYDSLGRTTNVMYRNTDNVLQQLNSYAYDERTFDYDFRTGLYDSFTYDSTALLSKMVTTNGDILVPEYNGFKQIDRVKIRHDESDSTNLLTFAYTYDNMNNITGVTRNRTAINSLSIWRTKLVNVKVIDGFEFVSIHYPFNQKKAIKIVTDTHPLKDYQEYISENGLEMADIIMPNLEIIRLCPTLKYLKICPSFNALPNFDFTPLYDSREIKSLNCQNQYGDRCKYISEIDYAQIHGLEDLFVGVNNSTLNYNKISTLKSLGVGGHKGINSDLTDLFCSRDLDTLRLIQCKNTSLNGLGTSSKMQCVYLHYNRSLSDITALRDVKSTLRALRIENCPKITDFSVLEDLENLELLELSGNNSLPSLDFLRKLKKLKTFVFSMNVVDGDLSLCKDLSYVFSSRDRKHYNLKDKDLPKGQYYRGNEDIEDWRRFE